MAEYFYDIIGMILGVIIFSFYIINLRSSTLINPFSRAFLRGFFASSSFNGIYKNFWPILNAFFEHKFLIDDSSSLLA